MPYIPIQDRRMINSGSPPMKAGELNYKLTKDILEYLGTEPNYQRFNDVLGALECLKLELYRRVISPYEDQKIRENTDVY